jgi:hypothetical protein
MANEVISYLEMCNREGTSLQQGMNFGLGGNHSVILMSVQPNAPYHDRFEEDGSTLIYEGHDQPRSAAFPQSKILDQPEFYQGGTRTQNGKFAQAAHDFKQGIRMPERVRVYEKLRAGIWPYNGIFHLVDYWREKTGGRNVFKFKLIVVEGEEDFSQPVSATAPRRRVIPTVAKLAVWKRDAGKCTMCGATDELHFDHVLPYAKGGTSVTEKNVQLLCSRHNLAKSDKII